VGARDDALLAELVRAYELAGQRLIDEVLARGFSQAIGRRASILRQVDGILFGLTGRASPLIEDFVSEAYQDGSQRAADRIRQELGDDLIVSFGLVDQDAVQALADRLFNDLGEATQSVRRKIAGLVQDTQLQELVNNQVRTEVAANIARGGTRRDLAALLQPLVRQGAVSADLAGRFSEVGSGLIQVGGWRGTVAQYSALVARTMQREAATIGAVNRAKANDLDIMEVSSHRGVEDSCRVFEGLLVSISGAEGFPPLNGLPRGGTPFHPHCRHVLLPRSTAFLTEGEVKAQTTIKRRFLGKTWGELERILKKEFQGNPARMRAFARS